MLACASRSPSTTATAKVAEAGFTRPGSADATTASLAAVAASCPGPWRSRPHRLAGVPCHAGTGSAAPPRGPGAPARGRDVGVVSSSRRRRRRPARPARLASPRRPAPWRPVAGVDQAPVADPATQAAGVSPKWSRLEGPGRHSLAVAVRADRPRALRAAPGPGGTPGSAGPCAGSGADRAAPRSPLAERGWRGERQRRCRAASRSLAELGEPAGAGAPQGQTGSSGRPRVQVGPAEPVWVGGRVSVQQTALARLTNPNRSCAAGPRGPGRTVACSSPEGIPGGGTLPTVPSRRGAPGRTSDDAEGGWDPHRVASRTVPSIGPTMPRIAWSRRRGRRYRRRAGPPPAAAGSAAAAGRGTCRARRRRRVMSPRWTHPGQP